MPHTADGTPLEPTLAERTKRSRTVELTRGAQPNWLALDQGLTEDCEAWGRMSEQERGDFLVELDEFMTTDKVELLASITRGGDFSDVLASAPRPAVWLAERRARFTPRPWLRALGEAVIAAAGPVPKDFNPQTASMAEKSAEARRQFQVIRGQSIITASSPFRSRAAEQDQGDPQQSGKLTPSKIAAILTGVSATDGQATRAPALQK